MNVSYKIMATQVYANSFEIDKKTGKQVLPGPAVDAASGLGFGLYEYDPDFTGSELDGEALGAAIATGIEQEQFGSAFGVVITTGVIITGVIVLGVIAVSFAVAWGAASEKAKRKSDNELSTMRINAQKDIAADPNIDAATKKELLQQIDVQQLREEGRKVAEAEKPGVGTEITKALIPIVIGISVLGLVMTVIEKRLVGAN
jgi:hypothetical protein